MPQKKLQKDISRVNKKKFRPIQAYIMTSIYPGTYTKSINDIKKLNYIEKISIVSGESEIIVKVNVKNLIQLHKLTSKLHKINGVERTNTRVIEKECIPSSKS